MLEYEISRWLSEWLSWLALDTGTVIIGYKDGHERKSQLKGFECKPFHAFALLLIEQMIGMLRGWVGLPSMASRFDGNTGKNFCLHQIFEMAFQVIISNYCAQARWSGASLFKVERFKETINLDLCGTFFFILMTLLMKRVGKRMWSVHRQHHTGITKMS